MTDFSYRLVILTHGASSTLEACLRSFAEHVSPAPAELVIVVDGPVTDAHRLHAVNMPDFFGSYWFLPSHNGQEGFCKATARAWAEGAKPGVTHSVHLEHDFLLTRDVDWREVASVLDVNPQLAQMALMRDAVNDEEKAAGGLFESRRDEYAKRDFTTRYDVSYPPGSNGHGAVLTEVESEFKWLQHRSYLTTNVSIMRRDWMEAHPWPDPEIVPLNCEGLHGFGLVQEGWYFGVWGSGEPWTEHVGVRDGSGHSY